MRKSLLTLFTSFLFFTGSISAQIVITEVFYNAPNTGSDTIEYIELYNNSSSAINLEGYNFSQGVVFSFPSYMLAANDYVVVTKNAQTMMDILGVTALQWLTGGLNNSGEDIQLNDADTILVDYINYDDGLFWPPQADGDGYSMELCDPNKDNSNPSNWAASSTNTGIVIQSVPIFGTPGQANDVPCANTVILTNNIFTPDTITINEGETIEWINTQGTHNVNGNTSVYPGNPESFFSGVPAAGWSFSHTFNIAGFYSYRCDLHFGQGMVGAVIVLPPPTEDIVINEIMYNPPGVDEIGEYIELYNKGNAPINLEGFSFSQGVNYIFPDVSIGVGEYLVIGSDSASLDALYGITARQWTSGGLTNSGEEIGLKDAQGNLIDYVDYNNNSPWAEIANGEGPSLILCSPEANNSVPSNWLHSVNNTGIVPGGSTDIVFASPGAANNCPVEPHIFFNGVSGVINEGDLFGTFSVRMPIFTVTDSADVQLVIHSSSTATDGIDYTLLETNLHFPPGLPGEVSEADIQVALIDDLDLEGDETIVLQLMNASGAIIATPGLYTITIEDNDGVSYPVYPIGTVSTVDPVQGIADSLGITCSLTGIVHGVNLRPDGLQFTIIDAGNDGIGVFSESLNYGYSVMEGDLVTIEGTIDQFNGLTQIVPDTVIFVSSNNPVWFSDVVTALDEGTESQMIRFNDMTIVNPADWTNAGSGFNVAITDGTNTVTMRIDADVNIFGTTPPAGSFDVVGIGGQFDNTAPHTEGYQILPRYIPDIITEPVLATQNDVVNIDVDEEIIIDVLDNDNTPFDIVSVNIVDQPVLGDVVVNTDFTITYTPDFGVCGVDAFSYVACDDMSVCDTSFVTVNIQCPVSYPQYDIDEVTTVDGDGLPDSLGVTCELEGIVYGVNLQGASGGLQFTIIDPNDAEAGIGVFSSTANGNLGYTVNQGDRIACQGEITSFNGLAQIEVVTVSLVSPANILHDPVTVTDLNEGTESRLVRLFNVTIVNDSDWDNSNPSGFNVPVTDGTNTWTVRIDNDVDLFNEPVPVGLLNITGIGGQFDSSLPHLDGYQLLPRYIADIEQASSTTNLDLEQQVDIYPNPVSEVLFVNSEVLLDRIQIYNELCQLSQSIEALSNNNSINTRGLSTGVYIITFEKDGYRWSEKFVKL